MMKRKLGYIFVIVFWSIVATLLTSCEKYEFQDSVYETPSLYSEWRLIQTEHIYLDINEVGPDSDTTWVINNGSTFIAMETELEFDLVTLHETKWEITPTLVIVDDENIYNINSEVYPSPSMNPYDQCWDINNNGYQDPFEDTNGDGICDLFDCPPEGIVIGVYNTVRVFNIIELTNDELQLEFEGQYFEDFDYYTTVLKFEKINR